MLEGERLGRESIASRPSDIAVRPLQTFSQRIKTRRRIWWGQPPPEGAWGMSRFTPHGWRDLYALRRRDDAEDAWRCCAWWQRKLINKWNGREFVIRHGGRVPALYWCARLPSQRRLRALPSHYVIRPIWGAHREGVYVVADGRDLLLGEPFSAAVVRRSILRSGMLARILPVMVEEFVRSEDPRFYLPIEYKCHTFGDTVAAIEVLERQTKKARRLFYTADWQLITDPMSTQGYRSEPRDPPRFLDEILRMATRLGRALGTYMRVDFFGTQGGCGFNEFSSTPANGEGWTPFCDDLFGGYWEDKCPDAT
jgi:hypothetical protein